MKTVLSVKIFELQRCLGEMKLRIFYRKDLLSVETAQLSCNFGMTVLLECFAFEWLWGNLISKVSSKMISLGDIFSSMTINFFFKSSKRHVSRVKS